MKKIRLMPRDKIILKHICEFKITTLEILHGCFFEDCKLPAVRSTMKRLSIAGLVTKKYLPNSKTKYFYLTQKGGRQIGADIGKKEPGNHKVGKLYGFLYFINQPCLGEQRRRCEKEQLLQFMPQRVDIFPKVDFYWVEKTAPDSDKREVHLGFTVVDLNASWRTLITRCVNQSRKFLSRGWFHDVMRAGRFELTLLVGSESKRQQLETHVAKHLPKKIHSDLKRAGLHNLRTSAINTRAELIPGLSVFNLTKSRTEKEGQA